MAFLLAVLLTFQADVTASTVQIDRDIAYLAPERKERLDLYRPHDRLSTDRLPAILLVHGGGWGMGSKSAAREENLGNTLAELGYVCASIDYELGSYSAPPWPRNLADVRDAVRFLRANSELYGIDPERIGAIGGSAGGHLVSMLGVAPASVGLAADGLFPDVSCEVDCVVNFYGVVSFLTRRETDEQGQSLEKPKDGPIPYLLGCRRKGNEALWADASPITHVTKDDPPFLVLHGKADTTVDWWQARDFHDRLVETGVTSELMLLEGIGHSFHLDLWNEDPMPPEVKAKVISFLDQHLRGTSD